MAGDSSLGRSRSFASNLERPFFSGAIFFNQSSSFTKSAKGLLSNKVRRIAGGVLLKQRDTTAAPAAHQSAGQPLVEEETTAHGDPLPKTSEVSVVGSAAQPRSPPMASAHPSSQAPAQCSNALATTATSVAAPSTQPLRSAHAWSADEDIPPGFEEQMLAPQQAPSQGGSTPRERCARQVVPKDPWHDACNDEEHFKLWLQAVEAARLVRSDFVSEWFMKAEDLKDQVKGCFVRVKLPSTQAQGVASPYMMTTILDVMTSMKGCAPEITLRVDRKAGLVNVRFLSDQPFLPEELWACMKEDAASFAKETMLATIARKQDLRRRIVNETAPRISKEQEDAVMSFLLASKETLPCPRQQLSYVEDTTPCRTSQPTFVFDKDEPHQMLIRQTPYGASSATPSDLVVQSVFTTISAPVGAFPLAVSCVHVGSQVGSPQNAQPFSKHLMQAPLDVCDQGACKDPSWRATCEHPPTPSFFPGPNVVKCTAVQDATTHATSDTRTPREQAGHAYQRDDPHGNFGGQRPRPLQENLWEGQCDKHCRSREEWWKPSILRGHQCSAPVKRDRQGEQMTQPPLKGEWEGRKDADEPWMSRGTGTKDGHVRAYGFGGLQFGPSDQVGVCEPKRARDDMGRDVVNCDNEGITVHKPPGLSKEDPKSKKIRKIDVFDRPTKQSTPERTIKLMGPHPTRWVTIRAFDGPRDRCAIFCAKPGITMETWQVGCRHVGVVEVDNVSRRVRVERPYVEMFTEDLVNGKIRSFIRKT